MDVLMDAMVVVRNSELHIVQSVQLALNQLKVE